MFDPRLRSVAIPIKCATTRRAANTLFSHVITGRGLVSSTYFLVTVRRGNINYAHTHTYIHFDLTSQTHNFRKVKSKIRIVLSRTQDSKTGQRIQISLLDANHIV